MLICFVFNYSGEKLHNIPYVEDSTNWENLYKRGVNMRQNVINGRYVFLFFTNHVKYLRFIFDYLTKHYKFCIGLIS